MQGQQLKRKNEENSQTSDSPKKQKQEISSHESSDSEDFEDFQTIAQNEVFNDSDYSEGFKELLQLYQDKLKSSLSWDAFLLEHPERAIFKRPHFSDLSKYNRKRERMGMTDFVEMISRDHSNPFVTISEIYRLISNFFDLSKHTGKIDPRSQYENQPYWHKAVNLYLQMIAPAVPKNNRDVNKGNHADKSVVRGHSLKWYEHKFKPYIPKGMHSAQVTKKRRGLQFLFKLTVEFSNPWKKGEYEDLESCLMDDPKVRKNWNDQETKEIFDVTNGHCYLCNCQLEFLHRSLGESGAWHIDHHLPFSIFPDLDLMINLLPACVDCNLKKRDSIPSNLYVKFPKWPHPTIETAWKNHHVQKLRQREESIKYQEYMQSENVNMKWFCEIEKIRQKIQTKK